MELPKNVQKEIIALMKPDGAYSQIPEKYQIFNRYARELGLL